MYFLLPRNFRWHTCNSFALFFFFSSLRPFKIHVFNFYFSYDNFFPIRHWFSGFTFSTNQFLYCIFPKSFYYGGIILCMQFSSTILIDKPSYVILVLFNILDIDKNLLIIYIFFFILNLYIHIVQMLF